MKLYQFKAELAGFEDAVRLLDRLTTEARNPTIEENQ